MANRRAYLFPFTKSMVVEEKISTEWKKSRESLRERGFKLLVLKWIEVMRKLVEFVCIYKDG